MDCAALASFTHTRHTRSAAPPNQAIGGGTKKRGYQGVSLRWDPLRQLGQLAGWVEFLEKYACFGHSLVPFGGEGCVAGMAPCGPVRPPLPRHDKKRQSAPTSQLPIPVAGRVVGVGLSQTMGYDDFSGLLAIRGGRGVVAGRFLRCSKTFSKNEIRPTPWNGGTNYFRHNSLRYWELRRFVPLRAPHTPSALA
jgi:hypothetical protein